MSVTLLSPVSCGGLMVEGEGLAEVKGAEDGDEPPEWKGGGVAEDSWPLLPNGNEDELLGGSGGEKRDPVSE